MQASNRILEDWYGKIKRGEIKLPRFQRHEAWDVNRISSMMNTIIEELPLGITLVLEVTDKEVFYSRYLESAPETRGRVLEQLLDGQQRLTAVWRVLHNNYDSQTYFVSVPSITRDGGGEGQKKTIRAVSRYYRENNQKYPLWCDSPPDCIARGLIPTQLLRPEDIQDEIDEWIMEATEPDRPSDPEKLEDFFNWRKSISDEIKDLRSTTKNYNLPYLSLPSNTPRKTALEVFINMNTNSQPLTTYDIIVAEVESEVGLPLHEKRDQLLETFTQIEHFDHPERLILNTSALLQDKIPSKRGAEEMDKIIMMDNWDIMADGLNRITSFLISEGVFDDKRLPTNVVLWVGAALYRFIPESGDERGWCEKILRKYIWRAFLTDRYESSAATHAYYDYLGLKKLFLSRLGQIEDDYSEKGIPIFDELEHEIASENAISTAGWPTRATILGRGVLAITLKLGALDFATGERVTGQNIERRNYHHIYPDSLLKEADILNRSIAVNCAFIEDDTNRNIGRKDPLLYMKERYNWADESTVHYRLSSHLIPIKELANGGYEMLGETDRIEKIIRDYEAFVEARSRLLAVAARHLCEGNPISAQSIINHTEHNVDLVSYGL